MTKKKIVFEGTPKEVRKKWLAYVRKNRKLKIGG